MAISGVILLWLCSEGPQNHELGYLEYCYDVLRKLLDLGATCDEFHQHFLMKRSESSGRHCKQVRLFLCFVADTCFGVIIP
jgi:hypothetical protein